jgi:tetratricopeptide (TPR) repeat protein
MRNRSLIPSLVLACVLAGLNGIAQGQDEGQDDLDKATRLKITANSLEQLSEVARLCESALEKGLDGENEKYARQLLTAALYERASRLCRPVLSGGQPDPRWRLLRQVALPDLQKIVQYDDEYGEAHLLIARLEMLPGGDRQRAQQAVDRTVELFKDDNKKLSQAIMLRGLLSDDPEKRLASLSEAIERDPENVEAWRARASHYLARGELKQATEDLNRLLEQDPENQTIRLTAGEALIGLEQYDEAIKHIDTAIEQQPTPTAYILRAQAQALQEKVDEAIKDLDQAIKLDARDADALSMRARLYYSQDRLALAAEDVRRWLQVTPDNPEAILLRSLISAAQADLPAAIRDMELLLKSDPENTDWQLQLALYYNAGERPRKAIEQYTGLIETDAENWMARRGRGDAYLSVGDHHKAVADYEQAYQLRADHSGLLNNFAWVLATSPDDDIRDGQRAIKLATKACELTEYKEAHILSTLAAGYAETGDFESARKWSQKAVEVSDEDVREQLRKELESYEQQKPWRERQQVEERQSEDDDSAAAGTGQTS